MRRYGPLLVLAAVAIVLLIWGGRIFGGDPGDGRTDYEVPRTEAVPALPEPLAVPPHPAPKPDDPHLAGAQDAPATPETGAVEPAAPPPVDPTAALDVAAVYAGDLPDGWNEATPAQRPHAIRPPGGRGPRLGPRGGGGGVGPTGHWSRFPPPPPPTGDADLFVVVVDETGRPVVGADLYLGPPASLHQPAVSFGDLRKIGKTEADGRLHVRDLPAGAAALAGNLQNQLNGPRGLDMRSSIPILLMDRATVRADLALPLSVGEFGAVTGIVVDAKERPVKGAAVVTGFVRVYSDADGRFELPQVPAGTQTVQASRSGYAPETVQVDVPKGGTKDTRIVLRFRESGRLRLEGRVSAAEGGGVAQATVYLIDETGRGTLRSVRTDDDGDYLFEDLPDRLAATALRVQAGRHQQGYAARVVHLADGISDSRLDITLPPRQVKVRFLLKDALSGTAVTRCRIDLEPLDEPERQVRGFLGTNTEGRFEHWYPAGRYRFTVEAPDHRTTIVDVDLVAPGETAEVTVGMAPRGPEAVQITLRVKVEDAGTAAPITKCRIALLDPGDGTEAARFEGREEDGVYSMPAPSGQWTLHVEAEGYEAGEESLTLATDPPEADVKVELRPR